MQSRVAALVPVASAAISNAPINRISFSACSDWGSRASGDRVTPLKSTVAARLVSSIRVLALMALAASCEASTIASAGLPL